MDVTPEQEATCLALIGFVPMGPFEGESPADKERKQRLRDEFAMAAMPVMLQLEATGVWNQSLDGIARRDHALQVAKAAYTMADAMLRARSATHD